ncbi:MAG: NAD+ synthase [Acidimicrobiales bacterium]
MGRLRVACCQLDPVVGDIAGNVARVVEALRHAEDAGCDLAVFSELVLTGYPPEDLLLKPGFVEDNVAALAEVARATSSCAAVVGFVDESQDLYNAAALCALGRVVGTYHKRVLPNYSVFDEQRYFAAGSGPYQLFMVGGVRVVMSICEDAWAPSGPVQQQGAGGAELVVNINASPYYAGRLAEREAMLATRASDASVALVYVNQVGGQDELVFDGASMVLDHSGKVVARAAQFEEALMVVDVEVRPVFRKRLLDPRGREPAEQWPVAVLEAGTSGALSPGRLRQPAPALAGLPVVAGEVTVALAPVEEVYRALVVGTRDYVTKNGFTDVVVGLSGGIDSSLVAHVAVDALGPARVHGVAMPSRYSSDASLSDAELVAKAAGIDLMTVPIEPAHAAMSEMLAPAFSVAGGCGSGLTEENIQSRVRGVVLMALSNHFGWMVLTTGNKSEMAVGYSTLYGDSAGGFAVIRDVPKTLVYCLARFLGEERIPASVLGKAPSAELRPGQRDDQSLPAYELLDPVLEEYVERDRTASELVSDGFDPELVGLVVRLVDRAEYKRRQGPPGVRVTPKAFGKDRRVPITNGYTGGGEPPANPPTGGAGGAGGGQAPGGGE